MSDVSEETCRMALIFLSEVGWSYPLLSVELSSTVVCTGREGAAGGRTLAGGSPTCGAGGVVG
jgi:hypothetical protein